MIFIWTGHGILVAVCFFVGTWLGSESVDYLGLDFPEQSRWLSQWWGGSALVLLYAATLGTPKKHPSEGPGYRNPHTLFYMPPALWVVIITGLSAWFTVREFKEYNAAVAAEELKPEALTQNRVWTDREGRLVKASLVAIRIDGSKSIAIFRRADGEQFEHPFSMFSDADQALLREVAAQK